MKIRPMDIADASPVADLAAQLGYPTDADTIAGRFARLGHGHAVFVAEDDIGLAGWIHVHDLCCVHADPTAKISGLVVAERSRGRGVGGRLLDRAERWARENGYATVMLYSNAVRERAHKFYLDRGYASGKTSRQFTKRVADRASGG